MFEQTLLGQAFEKNDLSRVIAFFQGYKLEQTGKPTPPPVAKTEAQPAQQSAVGLEALVAPGRPAGSTVDAGAQISGKVWTSQEIQEMTKRITQGRLSPEQANAFHKELHQAGAEGRIMG